MKTINNFFSEAASVSSRCVNNAGLELDHWIFPFDEQFELW